MDKYNCTKLDKKLEFNYGRFMHFECMLEAFTLLLFLYYIVTSNCHKSDAIRWYLQLLLDIFSYHRRHFLCYTSPDCLFNIESKLSLVEIESKYMLIWITERTSKYSYVDGWKWNCVRRKCPKVKW